MTIILFLHVLVSITLIGLILIQHGKGADAGAAFGSGSSSTVFGARGAASFLSRATSILATLFFTLSLILFISAARQAKQVTGPKGAVRDPINQPVTSKRPALSRPTVKPAAKPNAAKPATPATKEKSKP